ncbi:MAG: ABC transporter ATP-binding protein [Fibrobacterota bacterium]
MDTLIMNDLSKRYGGSKGSVQAIISLGGSFQGGKLSVIQGQSGSGKSTLLLMLGGMINPSSGAVLFNGQDITLMAAHEQRKYRSLNVGFVFQKFHLLPYLSVKENVLLPLSIGTRKKPALSGRLPELARRFNMTHRLDHRPGELSVGEQQRTALMRALIKDPTIILADEPTGNLDPENTTVVFEAMKAEARNGRLVVMVTHNTSLTTMGDEAFLLENGRMTRIS